MAKSLSQAKRKLTAVFVTDVVGYSRLMGDDHDATVKSLGEYREVFSSHIKKYRGRVVNAPGDSILAEFESVVDAVTSAVEIQREISERNQELAEHRKMQFRIGVNLGDVLVKDGELFGDGVNIAARLEGLADPGGICISRTVFDQVESRLNLHYEYMGEHAVKNIAKPVRAYRVLSEPGAAAHRVVEARQKLTAKWRRSVLATAVLVVLGGSGLLGWNYYHQRGTAVELARFQKEAALPLPDRPSIAVLAFDNLSGDPEQEFFSDGMTENVTALLARVPSIFVIARNSSFRYKGEPVDVRRVGRELGVRFVLEGSVQRAAERVRVTAQLIDAATGKHLWANRYDRRLVDLFDLQDEIALQIAKSLQVKLSVGEKSNITTRSTENIEAWEASVKAEHHFFRFTKEDNLLARELYEKAIRLDPKFAYSYVGLGWTHWADARFNRSADPAGSYTRALALANQALSMDDRGGLAYSLRSRIYLQNREYDKAIEENQRGLELEPNNPDMHLNMAVRLRFAGRAEEAVPFMERAKRLHPFHPPSFFHSMGLVYYFAGQYEKAIGEFESHINAKARGSVFNSNVLLAAAFAAAGQEREAHAKAAEILRENPSFTTKAYVEKGFGLYRDAEYRKRLMQHLRKAGLPE